MRGVGEIDQPSLDDELSLLTVDELHERVPTCDQRRAIISRDALACVDGFRTIVQLVMEYVLGIRCCIRCPNCSCADFFGSNAKPEGGFLGRADAVYEINKAIARRMHAGLRHF